MMTRKRNFKHYKPDCNINAVLLSDERSFVVVTEPCELDDCFGKIKTFAKPSSQYVCGEIIDRLAEYEALGYTPNQLHEILIGIHNIKLNMQEDK